jgi:hypothetical protein
MARDAIPLVKAGLCRRERPPHIAPRREEFTRARQYEIRRDRTTDRG